MSPARRSRSNRSRQSNRNGAKAKSHAAKSSTRDFWGYTLSDGQGLDGLRPSSDATAVVRSLGDPPLRNHSGVAPHYFAAVYQRASVVAGALAAANGLLDTDED